MEPALAEVCKDIRLGKILIQTNLDTGEPEVSGRGEHVEGERIGEYEGRYTNLRKYYDRTCCCCLPRPGPSSSQSRFPLSR